MIGGSEYVPAFGAPPPPSWSEWDERWYQRNRAWSMAGKILTVVGVGLIIGLAPVRDGEYAVGPGVLALMAGQLTWTGADLRGAVGMNRRGFDVPIAPGIVALVGTITFTPITWIAGPVQSARIRQAHEGIGYARSTGPSFATFGAGLGATF
jgi:hypothetical protein